MSLSSSSDTRYTTDAPRDSERPQDLIVFILGGTTYEEAKLVASLNSQFASGHGLGPAPNAGGGSAGNSNSNGVGVGSRILLGGSCVHNSKS